MTTTPRDLVQLQRDQAVQRATTLNTSLTTSSIVNAIVEGVSASTINDKGQVQTIKMVEPAVASAQYQILEAQYNEAIQEANNAISALNAGMPLLPFGVKTTDIPYAIYVKNMQNQSGGRTMTSQWTTQNTALYAYNSLSVMCGIPRTQAGAVIPIEQIAVHTPPRFIKNIRDNIADVYGSNDSYGYANTDFNPHINGYFSLQNPTSSNITFTLSLLLSAGATNTRAGVNLMIPDQTDTQIAAGAIPTLTITNAFDTINSFDTTTRNVSITIPANKSAIIHVYSSFRYITGSVNQNTYYVAQTILNLANALLGTPLRANLNLMYNVRAMIEHDHLNPSTPSRSVTRIEELFTIPADYQIPTYTATTLVQARNLAITGGLADYSYFNWHNPTDGSITPAIVVRPFANNAAALAGGVNVGNFYYNTTTQQVVVATA